MSLSLLPALHRTQQLSQAYYTFIVKEDEDEITLSVYDKQIRIKKCFELPINFTHPRQCEYSAFVYYNGEHVLTLAHKKSGVFFVGGFVFMHCEFDETPSLLKNNGKPPSMKIHLQLPN